MGRRGAAGKLRIIGGEWRGRKLPVPDLPGLRPTADRNRETLFNWLATEIAGRHCLDLFAGSGALGFEALSRGAATCLFVESAQTAARQLDASIQTLDAGNRARVLCRDALAVLRDPWPRPSPDLVFLDPPFAGDLLEQALALIQPHCDDDTILYLEYAKNQPPAALENWACRRSKDAGNVTYGLFERS